MICLKQKKVKPDKDGDRPSTKTSSEIWCFCKNNDLGGKMIICSNEDNCLSLKLRKEAENVIGGNWFHLKCLKRKSPPKGDWFCKKCKPLNLNKTETPRSFLKKLLLKENRKIAKVPKDGNCFYSSVVYIEKGSPLLHNLVRKKCVKN